MGEKMKEKCEFTGDTIALLNKQALSDSLYVRGTAKSRKTQAELLEFKQKTVKLWSAFLFIL